MVETISIAPAKELLMFSNERRFFKTKNTLQSKDFDILLLRLIFEHNTPHYEYYYDRGKEPKPTNKMLMLFDYLFQTNNIDFLNEHEGVYYNDYFFGKKHIMGKDLIYIINLEDNKTIFSFFL